jgi:hypothetical protein
MHLLMVSSSLSSVTYCIYSLGVYHVQTSSPVQTMQTPMRGVGSGFDGWEERWGLFMKTRPRAAPYRSKHFLQKTPDP